MVINLAQCGIFCYDEFMNKIYFISGVNGAGKSAIIPHLKKILPKEKYQVFDFDERGVPEDADRNWRISESKYWVEKGNELAKENINIIICGFIKPDDLPNIIGEESNEIKLILLDAEPEIIRQRLISRYIKNNIFDESQKIIGKPIQEFIASNVYFAPKMKELFEQSDYPIIDTSNLTLEDVARKAANIILK